MIFPKGTIMIFAYYGQGLSVGKIGVIVAPTVSVSDKNTQGPNKLMMMIEIALAPSSVQTIKQ